MHKLRSITFDKGKGQLRNKDRRKLKRKHRKGFCCIEMFDITYECGFTFSYTWGIKIDFRSQGTVFV